MDAHTINHSSNECHVTPEGQQAALHWLRVNRVAFARLLSEGGYRTQTTRRVAALCGLAHQWVLITCTGEMRSADGKTLLASFAELDRPTRNTASTDSAHGASQEMSFIPPVAEGALVSASL